MNVRRFVSVVLCTYNGERYLPKQLDSLIGQHRLPDELLVQDDRSVDATVAIVREFAGRAPFPVRLHVNERRLGVVHNFGVAVDRCSGDYVALCDQDDVWHADKLQRLERALDELGGDHRPALVHSDLRVIGAEAVTSSSFFERRGFRHEHPLPLAELLFQNYVTGCAAVFNRATLEIALPIPREASMHDWWFALIAAAAGQIRTLREPLVDYRSHATNVIGAKRTEWMAYLRPEQARQVFCRAVVQAEALGRRLDERGIGSPAAGLVQELTVRCRQGGWRAAWWTFMQGIRMQHSVATISLRFHVLAGLLSGCAGAYAKDGASA